MSLGAEVVSKAVHIAIHETVVERLQHRPKQRWSMTMRGRWIVADISQVRTSADGGPNHPALGEAGREACSLLVGVTRPANIVTDACCIHAVVELLALPSPRTIASQSCRSL